MTHQSATARTAKKLFRLFTIIIALWLSGTTTDIARAEESPNPLINFTFGKKYEGAALADPTGAQFWNSLYSSKSKPADRLAAIFDSANALISGASIRWSNDGYTINGNASSFNSKEYQELMSYYDVTSSTGVITIEGLEAGMYDLYVYTQVDKKSTWQNLSITINDQTLNTATPLTVPREFVEGVNYLVAEVATDEDGTLVINYAPGENSRYGVLNALQLRRTGDLELTIEGDDVGAVPEPTSMILLTTGLLAASFRQKKRVTS